MPDHDEILDLVVRVETRERLGQQLSECVISYHGLTFFDNYDRMVPARNIFEDVYVVPRKFSSNGRSDSHGFRSLFRKRNYDLGQSSPDMQDVLFRHESVQHLKVLRV